MTVQNVTTDLHTDVRLLSELTNSLDNDVRWYKTDFDENGPEGIRDTLEADLIALAMIREARSNLAVLERDLEQVLAKSMESKSFTIDGAGTFERSRKTARTQWDKEALLSAVRDSRLFNPHTGELIDESPLDKVLHVYNLPSPRLTALRDRGIDGDQFCHSEDVGYAIKHIS